MNTSVLTVSVSAFKCPVNAASKAQFSLNANCGTLFSHLDEGGVHLTNLPFKVTV